MTEDKDKIMELALDGRLSEQQAINYINSVCDDEQLVNEILQKIAVASVISTSNMKVAFDVIEWLKQKCTGNKKLMAGVVALMLSNGMLGAHTIQKGDSLWKLGGGTSKGVDNILALNSDLTKDTVLRPGMKIILPSETQKKPSAPAKQDTSLLGKTYYEVKKGDTFSGIAKKLGITTEMLKGFNPQIKDINKLSIGDKVFLDMQVIRNLRNQKPVAKPQTKTDAKTDFVARVIYAESGNSVEEMEMIAHLIINRMKSGMFPSSAYDVVRQRRQFSCVGGADGNVKYKNYSRNLNKATQKCYELAEKVVKGDASGLSGSDDYVFYCTKNLARNGVGINPSSKGLDATYGHPSGWGSYSVFKPVETSANHVFYTCAKAPKSKSSSIV
jgi:LysM repeat protein